VNKKNFRSYILRFVTPLLLMSVYYCGTDSTVDHLWSRMGDLFTIKKVIDETLVQGESSIYVQNGRVITLGLVNTEYNDLEAPEREKVADEVVDILLHQIKEKEEFKDVNKVVVNFIHHEKKFWVMDLTMTVDYYTYKI
jgi:hypothetical protein